MPFSMAQDGDEAGAVHELESGGDVLTREAVEGEVGLWAREEGVGIRRKV